MRTVEMQMPSNKEVAKSILRLSGGNKSEDLSLIHSLTRRKNAILDYFRLWRTDTISFTSVKKMIIL